MLASWRALRQASSDEDPASASEMRGGRIEVSSRGDEQSLPAATGSPLDDARPASGNPCRPRVHSHDLAARSR